MVLVAFGCGALQAAEIELAGSVVIDNPVSLALYNEKTNDSNIDLAEYYEFEEGRNLLLKYQDEALQQFKKSIDSDIIRNVKFVISQKKGGYSQIRNSVACAYNQFLESLKLCNIELGRAENVPHIWKSEFIPQFFTLYFSNSRKFLMEAVLLYQQLDLYLQILDKEKKRAVLKEDPASYTRISKEIAFIQKDLDCYDACLLLTRSSFGPKVEKTILNILSERLFEGKLERHPGLPGQMYRKWGARPLVAQATNKTDE